jgi:hypothetical protein
MLLVVAAALIRRQRAASDAEAAERRGTMRALARQKLQEGLALLKDGRAGEGRARLLVAAELDGQDTEIARALESLVPEARPVAPAAAAREAAPAQGAMGRPSAPIVMAASSARRPAAAPRVAGDAAVGQSELDGRRALGQRHLLAARELSRDEDLPGAAAHLRAALENDPENATARVEMDRVAERVREIYLRAYVGKDDDPEDARAGFALVARALPAGDELAARASHWLEKLDARSPR